MTTALTQIPQQDLIVFAGLPDAAKEEVAQWIGLVDRLMSAARIGEAIADEAARYRGRRGFSKATIRRRYDAFRRSGDWRVLVDRARFPSKREGLPTDFTEYWKGLCERHQRNSKAAHRAIVREWERGETIKGYKTRPAAHGMTGLPWGWTYANLMRHVPTKFELTAARIGRGAATSYRPLVFSSRKGLSVGQYYLFDDMEHNVKVNMLGVNKKAMRPLELAALDLLSGCKIAWGMKPCIENELTGKKEKLKESEMRFLVAHILTNIGYRPEGTVLVVEHGTAAIRPDLEAKLKDWTDGAITVDRSGREGAATFAGLYEGRPKGKARFKAAIESHHNYAQNELSAITGQMGKDRHHAPEELHGRDKKNSALIRAIAALPPARADLLRLPFLEYNQYQDVVTQLYGEINRRTEHRLEGWVEAGFVVNEFRLDESMPWQSIETLLALPEDRQQAVAAVITQPGLSRTRKASPWEVWKKGRDELVRLPGWCVPQILGLDNARERKIRPDHMIEFQDRDISPSIHRYDAIAVRADGEREQLRPGDTYLTHVNPFDPSRLFISATGSKTGAYIGVCKRVESICRSDTDALVRQVGRSRKREAELLRPVARRGADIMRREIEIAKNNTRVLSGAAMLKEELEHDDRLQAVDLSADDLTAATEHDTRKDDDGDFSTEEIATILQRD